MYINMMYILSNNIGHNNKKFTVLHSNKNHIISGDSDISLVIVLSFFKLFCKM